MPKLVPQVYISYKGKIELFFSYLLVFYVYTFLVSFIGKVFKHIFYAYNIKKN